MGAIFGETLTFPQRDGSVELVVYGDEFHARYETVAGFTVVHDTDLGVWCYALRTEGRLVSSGVPVAKPAPPGVRRHLKESATVRAEVAGSRYRTLRPVVAPHAGMSRTFGANRGLLSGRRVSEGAVKGLTILVEFSDVTSTVTPADVTALLNEPGYSRNGNRGSVRDYFLEASAGKLDYRNVVVGPVKLPQPQAFYIQTSLVPDALTAAVTQFGVDLADFDSLGQRTVDAINFLYAGRTLYQGELWPHNAERVMTFGAMRTRFYMLTSMGRHAVDLSIGTFCHETGHLLCRFPDIYDYGERDGDLQESAGIGSFCLMGSGNHLSGGRSPAGVCAYLRDLVGWCDDVVLLNSPGQFTAGVGENSRLLKFETNRPNEYFLVENRTATGRDSALPASGLAVYHCDTLGSNEWEDRTRERHYQVALLQADGHLDLEHNRNLGDATDLFGPAAGVVLSSTTTPASRLWDGSDSGLVLRDVGAPGPQIRFSTGVGPTPGRFGSEADLVIPDGDPSGASSEVAVDAVGVLTGLVVTVDILHPAVGDLRVFLVTPDGATVTLRDRQGGASDDLHVTYDSATDSVLAPVLGLRATGTWSLRVVDAAGGSTGRLDRWWLEVRTEPATPVIERRSRPDLPIPDNRPAGVSDSIAITQAGAVRAVRVEVDIRHPFIGDLSVDLVTPTGAAVALHQRTGGSRADIVAAYDATTTPALAALVGTPMSGTWTLHVRDTAARDVGRLASWALFLTG